jgi:arylformamidase
MIKIIDISWPLIEKMTEYKDNKFFSASRNTNSNGAMETHLCLNSHSGTHIDAPAHFIADGKTLDQLPLESFLGTSQVINISHLKDKISQADLAHFSMSEGDIILLKTANSYRDACAPFDPNFVYLSHDAALYLVEKKIKAIGFDYLGIERNQPDHQSHKTFMIAQIPIIEGLRLGHVDAGRYFFYGMPLALKGTDAAPARALLIQGIN